MKKIILFKDEESKIIEELLRVLKTEGRNEEIKIIFNNRIALREQANSISLYPSIMYEQHLGKAIRTVDSLVKSLCEESKLDLRFYLPTKAIVGNGFTIAKINFFYMLFYLTRDIPELNELQKAIKNAIAHNVFSIMAEEVFLGLLNDSSIVHEVRMKAGYLLVNLWEYRLDYGVRRFSPILSNIWEARETLTPTFGTMMGFSELFKISEKTEPAFLDFFQRDELADEEFEAMEEFIFGLSYEELERLRMEMEKNCCHVVTRTEVEKMIGHKMVYPEYKISDPREFYRSYKDRKLNAKFRGVKKVCGPKKTIEEYLMCYLLSQSKEEIAVLEDSFTFS